MSSILEVWRPASGALRDAGSMHLTNDENRAKERADRPALDQTSSTGKECLLTPGADPDIDAQLDCGVAVLRASGRLLYGDRELDRALVLEIVDAVMGATQ